MKTQKSTMTLTQWADALTQGNANYVSRTIAAGKVPNVNAQGMNPDFSFALAWVSKFSETQVTAINALGIGDAILSGTIAATNTKVAKRIPALVDFLISGDVNAARYMKVAIGSVCALTVANVKTREGLRFAVTGKGNESTSDEVQVDKARAIVNALGAVGATTAPTQLSSAFSQGGICDVLGIASPRLPGAELPTVNATAPAYKALARSVNKLTDGAIALIAAKGKGKGETQE